LEALPFNKKNYLHQHLAVPTANSFFRPYLSNQFLVRCQVLEAPLTNILNAYGNVFWGEAISIHTKLTAHL
jgi:hypothetical protein